LLTQKKVIETKKANMPNDIAKAIGRISGGLYVVTATKGSSKGAMVASWVSQVSDLLAFFLDSLTSLLRKHPPRVL
jgi:flavin reductase (DIM6/NTAB) family NADH-FMN oxidoreductase RutF